MTASPVSAPAPQPLLHGIADLPHLGVIAVSGADARTFLHSQLTQDFALLRPGQARLAAFLSPKGRMQASFVAMQGAAADTANAPETAQADDASAFFLVCSRDVLPAVLKRLSMFVLRAKAKLRDVSDEMQLRGIIGAPLQALLGGAAVPSPWSQTDLPSGAHWVQLYPSANQPRAMWLAPAGVAPPEGPALPTDAWLWTEVVSGVATLSAPLVDAFVPQMLNYESVDGVNFKKGCYPGQEVVARSQFRGTLKRRAYIAHAAGAQVADLPAGAEVFADGDAEQPVGLIVQAAPSPDGSGVDVLLSMQIAASERALHGGSPSGPALSLQPLPYPLREDL